MGARGCHRHIVRERLHCRGRHAAEAQTRPQKKKQVFPACARAVRPCSSATNSRNSLQVLPREVGPNKSAESDRNLSAPCASVDAGRGPRTATRARASATRTRASPARTTAPPVRTHTHCRAAGGRVAAAGTAADLSAGDAMSAPAVPQTPQAGAQPRSLPQTPPQRQSRRCPGRCPRHRRSGSRGSHPQQQAPGKTKSRSCARAVRLRFAIHRARATCGARCATSSRPRITRGARLRQRAPAMATRAATRASGRSRARRSSCVEAAARCLCTCAGHRRYSAACAQRSTWRERQTPSVTSTAARAARCSCTRTARRLCAVQCAKQSRKQRALPTLRRRAQLQRVARVKRHALSRAATTTCARSSSRTHRPSTPLGGSSPIWPWALPSIMRGQPTPSRARGNWPRSRPTSTNDERRSSGKGGGGGAAPTEREKALAPSAAQTGEARDPQLPRREGAERASDRAHM